MSDRRDRRTQGEGGIDLLVQETFFRDRSSGVFVDVGAARPDYLSMSAIYRESGWRVIAVEPNPDFCAMHRAAGHEVLQYACADYDADDVPFSVVDSQQQPYRDGHVTYESFSAISLKESYRALRPDLEFRRIPVHVRRLDRILAEHAEDVEAIDVLSIDVEGWELEVLRGLSLDRYRPTVIIVENFLHDPVYPQYLLGSGYVLWKRSPPNEVYVRVDAMDALSRLRLALYTRITAFLHRLRRNRP